MPENEQPDGDMPAAVTHMGAEATFSMRGGRTANARVREDARTRAAAVKRCAAFGACGITKIWLYSGKRSAAEGSEGR
jgi:hypothetical protein